MTRYLEVYIHHINFIFSLDFCLCFILDCCSSSFLLCIPATHDPQVAAIKRALPHVCVIANGNVQCFEDAVRNRATTGADGIMSAEVRPEYRCPFLADV